LNKLVPGAILTTVLLGIIPIPRALDVYVLKYSFLQVSGVVWALLVVLGLLNPTWLDRKSMTGPAAALAVAMIVSVVSSYDPAGLAIFGGPYYWGLTSWLAAILVFVVSATVSFDDRIRLAINTSLIGFGLLALVAIAQRFTGTQVSAGFDNSNHLVLVLAGVPAIALGGAVAANGTPWKAVLLTVSGLSLVACALSGSSAGLVGSLVGLVFLLFFWPGLLLSGRREVSLLRYSLGLAAMVVMLVVLLSGSAQMAIRWQAKDT
jgi:hypothetical protein